MSLSLIATENEAQPCTLRAVTRAYLSKQGQALALSLGHTLRSASKGLIYDVSVVGVDIFLLVVTVCCIGSEFRT